MRFALSTVLATVLALLCLSAFAKAQSWDLQLNTSVPSPSGNIDGVNGGVVNVSVDATPVGGPAAMFGYQIEFNMPVAGVQLSNVSSFAPFTTNLFISGVTGAQASPALTTAPFLTIDSNTYSTSGEITPAGPGNFNFLLGDNAFSPNPGITTPQTLLTFDLLIPGGLSNGTYELEMLLETDPFVFDAYVFDNTVLTPLTANTTNGFFTVPEPATLALLAVGGVALLKRRRGKTNE